MAKHNKGVLENLIWKFSERFVAQIVTLIVSIILARILEPSHYGMVSMVTIFITFANVFVSDSFGSALIQKKDADTVDFSTILYFNIFLSILIYILLYMMSPFVAHFYGEGYEMLTPVMRILGLQIIIAGVNSVQQAYISRQMMFEKFFWATLFGTIVSGVVGILMAYCGFGIWALVAQYLSNTFVNTVVLTAILNKKPLLSFSFQRLRNLFKFGAQILGTNMLITAYMELRALIIGKIYSAEALSYYDKGRQFPSLLVTNLNSSISAVLFPKMSKEQDSLTKIKQTTRISIRLGSYILCPVMLGMAAIAKTFVCVVLTKKWLPCVPLLQLFCIIYLFQPIHTANMQAIKAIGRSDIYLKLELVKKAIELLAFIAVMKISVNAIVVAMAVFTTLFTFINAYPNKKLLHYPFIEQMKDLLPAFLMAIVMMLLIIPMNRLPIDGIILLLTQILSGAIIYLFLSIITKNEEFRYIMKLLIGIKYR